MDKEKKKTQFGVKWNSYSHWEYSISDIFS